MFIKVVHIVRQFYPSIGGLESHVESLALEQIKQGHRVYVVTLNYSFSKNLKLNSEEKYKGIHIFRVKHLFGKKYPAFIGVKKVIKEIEPDIIHIHAIDSFLEYSVFFLRKYKKAISTHGGFFHTNSKSIFKKLFFSSITRNSLRYIDKVIAISKSDYNKFSEIVDERNLLLNENAVEDYGPESEAKMDQLLFVGRFSVNKNIKKLIEISSYLSIKKIIIAGVEYDYKREDIIKLKEKYDKDNKVEVRIGVTREELKELYRETKYFISLSDYEGFGMTAIEAMSAGCIPILNNIPQFKRIISESEVGFLIDISDEKNAIELINKGIKQEIDNSKCLDYAKKFSWQNNCSKVMKVYEDL